jgi:hypothetical protein
MPPGRGWINLSLRAALMLISPAGLRGVDALAGR